MKKLLLTFSLLANLTWAIPFAEAQNTTCSDRPASDNSNACANTRWVKANGGGGGGVPGGTNGQVQYNNAGAFGGLNNIQLTADIQLFTSILSGAAPASGGGIVNFLRADGTWVPPGGGSAVVGTILPWTGGTVPTTYLLAYGQAVSRSTYSDLLTAITLTNSSITCALGSPSITVAADVANRAPVGAPIESSACFSGGSTVLSKGATTLTLSTNAIASTTTNIVIFPWGNGNGSTTFNIPNLQGRTLVGRDNMSGSAAGVLTTSLYGTNPDALGAVGGTQSKTLVQANLPAATLATTITDPGHTHSINTSATAGLFNNNGGGGGAFSAMSSTGAAISTNTTGITASTALGGSSTPFAIIQPSVTVDWIIKAQNDSSINGNITVGVTTISGGTTNNILYDNAGVVGELAIATDAQYLAGTANKIVQAGTLYQAETTTTYGTTTTFDFSTFINTAVTLTGNITTQTLTNVQAGKAGTIAFVQDGTGSRTTVWNSIFKFAGGTTPTLTTTAGAVDILPYSCRSATFCIASLIKDVK